MRLTWNSALEETEMVLFESVHKLFKATGVNAQDVSPSAGLNLYRRVPVCAAEGRVYRDCDPDGCDLDGCDPLSMMLSKHEEFWPDHSPRVYLALCVDITSCSSAKKRRL